jgi:hypothetical protein
MNKQMVILLVLGAFTAGCGGVDEPKPADQSGDRALVAPSSAARIAGYRHRPDASRFRLGEGVIGDSRAGTERLVGSEGVIAVTRHGATLAVPNATAHALMVPALSSDPAVHNARVLRYFAEAGLPSAQVGDVHVTTVMEGGGAADHPGRPGAAAMPAERRFVAYNTVIDRRVEGFRVAGSYAWARFNAEDEVVAEEVFWPELPAALLDEARAIRDKLQDPAREGAFRAALPAELHDGQAEVVIRHTPHMQREMASLVMIEVSSREHLMQRHFALDGRELQLPRDPPAAIDSPR